jgi:hypothetical protein
MAAIANAYSDYAFVSALDTSGNATDHLECRNFRNHTLAFTATAATTTVRAEGSLDGVNFFGVDPSGNNSPDASGNTTYTNPGTYCLSLSETAINYIRLKLVSYTGPDTSHSVTAITYRGGL